ncbi:MAG: NADP-dependent aryl-alcohol dehydrogenase [Chitinophagales bacterium]|nr:MAG: NADP-dependent aryl-alcohol dehydrogenase [Chitinophagales bacterium]
MEYRKLGRSGLKVSALSLGSWVTFGSQISDAVAEELMTYAYDNGINFFDNAESYASGRSEVVMGQILKRKNWDRTTYLVSSKVFWGGDKPNQKGLSRKHVTEACHAALKRLQVEYLDLYFCHRPDKTTPIEETVWAMHSLIMQGKVLYWGTSEWTAQEITAAFLAAEKYNLIPPAMEQPQYNMLHRYRIESEYARLFRDFGIGTTIWSPLASGVLTGKYNEGIPPDSRVALTDMQWLKEMVSKKENLQKTQLLAQVAKRLGVTLPQMAIAWCLKNPNVSTVILGASRLAQLKENMESIKVIDRLTAEVMEEIEQILQNKPQEEWF